MLQPRRLCTEHYSPSKRERAVQRSSYSSPRSDEHEAQLQRNWSIQANVLQFEQKDKPAAQVSTASIRDLSLGEESKQVSGLPMKVGKAAAPYGGGRVVSLFANKEYDTVTLEYADSEGGVHGAIFQLEKGQGKLLKDELLARGVSLDSGDEQPTKQSTPEVQSENK